MPSSRIAALRGRLTRFAEAERLRPDLACAVRTTVALMVPMILAAAGVLSPWAVFAALSAEGIALADVRGPYTVRLGVLGGAALIFAGAAWLGQAMHGHILEAALGAALMGLLVGACQHLASDYGRTVGIQAAVLFFIALAAPAGEGGEILRMALGGGLFGLLLQIAHWPIRPQQPLRRQVAESWAALADFAAAMTADPSECQARMADSEIALRNALNRSQDALAQARATRAGNQVAAHLETLRGAAARLASRLAALEERAAHGGAFPPALAPVLDSIAATARTIGLAVISRRGDHYRLCELRLQRLGNLLRTMEGRAAAQYGEGSQAEEILRQMEALLPEIHAALAIAVDRAQERAVFALELMDVGTWTFRPIAAALNLSPRVDGALLRYALRLAVLLAIGVAAYLRFDFHHGYWLPITFLVVLQPDYGATRQRLAQRVVGTVAGVAAAGLLLALKLPAPWVLTATAATTFWFAFYVRRDYGRAVFFVTIMVMLLLEPRGPEALQVLEWRLGLTLLGAVLAVAATFALWPAWEKERLPAFLARAFQADRIFLAALMSRMAEGGAYGSEVVTAKVAAETAAGAAHASLQRLFSEPRSQQQDPASAAMLVNGNRRLVRALSALMLELTEDRQPSDPAALATFQNAADGALALLAAGMAPDTGSLQSAKAALDRLHFRASSDRRKSRILAQAAIAATELGALLTALEPARDAA